MLNFHEKIYCVSDNKLFRQKYTFLKNLSKKSHKKIIVFKRVTKSGESLQLQKSVPKNPQFQPSQSSVSLVVSEKQASQI
jgi:hypothetical protein